MAWEEGYVELPDWSFKRDGGARTAIVGVATVIAALFRPGRLLSINSYAASLNNLGWDCRFFGNWVLALLKHSPRLAHGMNLKDGLRQIDADGGKLFDG